MDNRNITRRQILGGLAVSGGLGALVGSSTTAILTDTEGLEASHITSGVVDITVDVTQDKDGSTTTLTVSLPSDSGGTNIDNNPSYVWVRSLECPEPSDGGALKVELRLKCDGSQRTLQSGKLGDVLASQDLREGFLLSCDQNDASCLMPGETRKLTFEAVDKSQSIEDIEISLEFFAQQCRNNTPPENPFGAPEAPNSCDTTAPPPEPPATP
jgi:hypothetical protein